MVAQKLPRREPFVAHRKSALVGLPRVHPRLVIPQAQECLESHPTFGAHVRLAHRQAAVRMLRSDVVPEGVPQRERRRALGIGASERLRKRKTAIV